MGFLFLLTGVPAPLAIRQLTDPGTTPAKPRAQILFGAAVAFAYCMCMVLHIVFGLFFALTAVCSLRGVFLYASAWRGQHAAGTIKVKGPLVASP